MLRQVQNMNLFFLFILFHASLLMFVINYVSKTRDIVKIHIFVNIYLAFSE